VLDIQPPKSFRKRFKAYFPFSFLSMAPLALGPLPDFLHGGELL
jgi:hypothetical protein